MTDLGSGINPVTADNVEFTNIALDADPENVKPVVKKKQPRRILHFSDGVLEEYSTDEEEEVKPPPAPAVDPKTLTWMPWFWYYIVAVASRSLSAADFCGEKLAWFFGITKPKYQYAIDEYYRLKEEEEREKERQDRIVEKLQSEQLSSVNVQQDVVDKDSEGTKRLQQEELKKY